MQCIKCLMCGRVSYHPQDIAHLFCGRCNKWHDARAACPTFRIETIEVEQRRGPRDIRS